MEEAVWRGGEGLVLHSDSILLGGEESYLGMGGLRDEDCPVGGRRVGSNSTCLVESFFCFGGDEEVGGGGEREGGGIGFGLFVGFGEGGGTFSFGVFGGGGEEGGEGGGGG